MRTFSRLFCALEIRSTTQVCYFLPNLPLDLFVSGATDGIVNLWELRNPDNGSMFIIEKIFEFPLLRDVDRPL